MIKIQIMGTVDSENRDGGFRHAMCRVVHDFERGVARSLISCRGFAPGRLLLAAVSGGADSVAMLRAVCAVAPGLGMRVEAVNCNFHLRGDESDRDSGFVVALCHRLGVRLHCVDLDVGAYRSTHPGESVEMACRTLRYTRFREIAADRGVWRIVTGHNADDNGETLLLNLMRGSGIRGLKAMTSDSAGVARPLLGMDRVAIESYLKALGQDYVTDSTNLASDYRRNFIRNEVFPLLETRWPSSRASVARSASLLAEEYLLVREALERIAPEGTLTLTFAAVDGSGAPVSVLNHWISRYGGGPEQAAEMARTPRRVGGRWEMTGPDNVCRVVEARAGEWVLVTPPATCESVPLSRSAGLEVREVRMDDSEWRRLRAMTPSEGVYLPMGPENYAVRHVRTGDRMRPSGMRGTKLLSDLMREAGVPVSMRSGLRVVTDSEGEVIWLEGVRRSERGRVPGDAAVAWLVSPVGDGPR